MAIEVKDTDLPEYGKRLFEAGLPFTCNLDIKTGTVRLFVRATPEQLKAAIG